MANVEIEKLTEEIVTGLEAEIKGILENAAECAQRGDTPSLEVRGV